MKNIFFTLSILFGLLLSSNGQSGLFISSGTSFQIAPATTVAIDGLVLTPSLPFHLSGSNLLSRQINTSHSFPGTHIGRVYQWSATTENFSGDIAFLYNDAELNEITEARLSLFTHTGSMWRLQSTTNRDVVNNIIYSGGLSNVSLQELTLADAATPLPLRWYRVNAKRQGDNSALVIWQTFDEVETAFFIVEQSVNGVNWQPVGQPVASFAVPGRHAYQLIDPETPKKKTFYRIKQVDQDGRCSYSPIVSINAISEKLDWIIYPNPASNIVTISGSGLLLKELRLYDASGHMLMKKAGNDSKHFTVPIKTFPNGVYTVQLLLADGSIYNRTFIKK